MSEDKEVIFGKLCVQHGYLTSDQVDRARANQTAAEKLGMTFSLQDVMTAMALLDRDQCDELMRFVRVQTGEAPVVGNYEVLAKLGEGGMGVVYKARALNSENLVALKVLPPAMARSAKLLKRFRREADIVRTLEHENIVQFVEFGQDKERKLYYCAMELIDGEDIEKRVKRDGPIPEKDALNIAVQIAQALRHAGSQGLVHRDVKPQNIMITPDGKAKLLDLGLARNVAGEDTQLTQAGAFIGSPHYSSPEQILGERDVDITGDIYSLGATMYFMLTGDTPFSSASGVGVLTQVMSEQIPWPAEINPDVSWDSCRILEKMMAKDTADRYASPDDVINDLNRILNGEKPVAGILPNKSAIRRPKPQKYIRNTRGAKRTVKKSARKSSAFRHTAIIYGAVILVAFLVAGLVVARNRNANPQTDTNTAESNHAPDGTPSQSSSQADAPRNNAPAGGRTTKKQPPPTDSIRVADLRKQFEDITQYASKYKKDFKGIIAKLERIRAKAAGTPVAADVDKAIASVRETWRLAARKTLESIMASAEKHMARSNYDTALAEIHAIPNVMAEPVQEDILALRNRLVSAATQQLDAVISHADALLNTGDYRAARQALKEINTIRYRAGREAIDNRLADLNSRIDRAEKKAESEQRRQAADLLNDYLAFIRNRNYSQAATWASKTAQADGNRTFSTWMAAAGRIATCLANRYAMIRNAASRLTNQTVTLKTVTGPESGTVSTVTDGGIELIQRIIISGVPKGSRTTTISWDKLARSQEHDFAADWLSDEPDNIAARAVLFLAKGDEAAADPLLSRIADHPMAVWIRLAIAQKHINERDAAAQSTWEAIISSPDAKTITTETAPALMEKIVAFEKEYGDAPFMETVRDDIKKLRHRLRGKTIDWVNVSLKTTPVKMIGMVKKTFQDGVLSVAIPEKKGSAFIPILNNTRDVNLRFEYQATNFELHLRSNTASLGKVRIRFNETGLVVMVYSVDNSGAFLSVIGQSTPSAGYRSTRHKLELALKGKTMSLTLDGSHIAIDPLPAVGVGEVLFSVYGSKDGFRLWNLAMARPELDSDGGTAFGLMTDKESDYIDVIIDGESEPRRFFYRKNGGDYDPAVRTAVAQIYRYDRVRLTWKIVDDDFFVASIAATPPADTSGASTGIVTHTGRTWFEIVPDDKRVQRFMARYANNEYNADDLNTIRNLHFGDRVTVGWEYDHRKYFTRVRMIKAAPHDIDE